jgi:hypothetical protein
MTKFFNFLNAMCVVFFIFAGSVYAADEVEPNNSAENASPLVLNAESAGTSSDKNDSDYYRFELGADGNTVITLKHENIIDSGETHWYADLYPEDDFSNSILRLHLPGNTLSNSVEEALSAGVYYIRVNPYYHSTDHYSLTVAFTASNYYEKSSNNTVTNATPLKLNHEYFGNSSNDKDIDYYLFELAADGNVLITLTHGDIIDSGETYWYIRLYPEDNLSQQILQLNLKGNVLSSSVQEGLSAGKYYVQLNPYYHSLDRYSLTVAFTASDYYEKSSNGTTGNATFLELNHEYKGNCSNDKDMDYYSF